MKSKKINFKNDKNGLLIFIISILLAILGHSFYLYRFFKEGTIFTGPNDGLEQMLPMQLYLYKKMMSGEWFYSLDFGLGGDHYTDLAYYYSTSIVFFINALIIKFVSFFIDLKTDTITFWAKNAFFISILKSSIAMTITYYYFKVIHKKSFFGFLFGFLFLTSAIYFRFTLYWSFFSDVFIFLPLLLLSIELYIRKNHKALFIATVAMIFINNFYFAYHLVIIGFVYFLYRNLLPTTFDTVPRLKQWIHFIVMAVLGVLISSFAFFYAAYGFLGNDRSPYKEPLKLFSPFDQYANIFYDNYLVIVLIITVQALLTFTLYKHYYYRMFAIFTFVLLILSCMPFMDSLFNGFSAPQKRWHYLITFASSGLITLYIYYFKTIPLKHYLVTIIPGIFILFFSATQIQKPETITWIYIAMIIHIVGALVLYFVNKTYQHYLYLFMITLIMFMNLDVVRLHNKIDNYNAGINPRANLKYIESSVYDSQLQRQIVNTYQQKLKPGERIDFRVLEQDNTPMYQGFKGVSLYSSIFDGRLIDFYYRDLMINLKEESISRYSTFNSRSNLASLFNVKYLIRKQYQTDIPENFKLIKDYGKYKVYENQYMLPFGKITNNIYREKDLKTPIDREHAMMTGVITKQKKASQNPVIQNKNLVDVAKVKTSNAHWSYNKKQLIVNPGSGGLVVTVPDKYLKDQKDFYIEMHVSLIAPVKNFQINVNGYANNRLFQSSKYRTHQDDLTYRIKIPKHKKILIGLSEGTYNFKLKGIYTEDYQTLKQESKNIPLDFTFNEKDMKFDIKNSSKGYFVTPIVYRDGLTAYVNGKKEKIENVNYLMSAVKVDENTKSIQFKYLPPHFILICFISIIGLLFSCIYLYLPKFLKRKQK